MIIIPDFLPGDTIYYLKKVETPDGRPLFEIKGPIKIRLMGISISKTPSFGFVQKGEYFFRNTIYVEDSNASVNYCFTSSVDIVKCLNYINGKILLNQFYQDPEGKGYCGKCNHKKETHDFFETICRD